MLLRYIIEERKNQFLTRATIYVEFAHSSHAFAGFLWGLLFLPTPHRYAHEVNWSV